MNYRRRKKTEEFWCVQKHRKSDNFVHWNHLPFIAIAKFCLVAMVTIYTQDQADVCYHNFLRLVHVVKKMIIFLCLLFFPEAHTASQVRLSKGQGLSNGSVQNVLSRNLLGSSWSLTLCT